MGNGEIGLFHPEFITWNSGDTAEVEYIYIHEGDYTIKVRVFDRYNAPGDWSELKVSIPRNKPITNNWLQKLFEKWEFTILDKIINKLI
jgi:hypothetical protein